MSLLGMITGANRRNKIRDIIDEGGLVIDVRDKEEYLKGHFTGARNMPLSVLNARVDTIKKEGKPVVVYCASGARSKQAIEILNNNGILCADGKTLSKMQSLMLSNF